MAVPYDMPRVPFLGIRNPGAGFNPSISRAHKPGVSSLQIYFAYAIAADIRDHYYTIAFVTW